MKKNEIGYIQELLQPDPISAEKEFYRYCKPNDHLFPSKEVIYRS